MKGMKKVVNFKEFNKDSFIKEQEGNIDNQKETVVLSKDDFLHIINSPVEYLERELSSIRGELEMTKQGAEYYERLEALETRLDEIRGTLQYQANNFKEGNYYD